MSNPWKTRDIGRGPIGLTRTQKITPGIIDINSRFDGVLVAAGPKRRIELRQTRKTLKHNQLIIDRDSMISQRCKNTAKAALQDAIDALNKVLRKKGPIKDESLKIISKKANVAIATAERLRKYNTPPWRKVMLRFFLFEDLLEARTLYSNTKIRSEKVRATGAKITEAVTPYGRAMNLLARIDAPEPPNGNTIVDGTYPARAWPKSGEFSADKKNARFHYEKMSKAITDRKQEIAQDTGGVSNHEATLDELMDRESDWFRVLTADLSATNRQQVNKYLKILWGKSAELKTYKTQFIVDFEEDEVPPPEAIKQPADTK